MKTSTAPMQNDLHLSLDRERPCCWAVKHSPAKYFIPVKNHKGNHGSVFIQGICCDNSGKELSVAEVSALIDKHGMQALDHLDGTFVIAVDDDRDGVWCATDHSATLPLYYSLTSKELIISTRPENMTFSSDADIDLAGVLSTLNTGYPWGELTLHSSWKVLRPGNVLVADKSGNVTVKEYFLGENDTEVQGFTSPTELLQELEKSVTALASRYKKLLIPLSGGVDSRLITLTCHKLGIPFEAITFVANVPDGDDFDIASRLVKIYGVKHHRWEWTPSKDTLEHFYKLCMSTGGTNDAYTTYPDGMRFFADVASQFDCVLRGDHSFGFGNHSESLFQSAYELCINYKDDLNWMLKDEYRNKTNLESVFEEQEQVCAQLKGTAVNEWRHRSRRLTRNPRAHLPIGQLQAEHVTIGYPLLSRNIVKRMARTATELKNNKQIAHDALAILSPPDVKKIPHSSRHTWLSGEPLLNLPREVLDGMVDFISKPGVLSDMIDELAAVGRFTPMLENAGGKPARASLTKNAKQLIKKLLPRRMLHTYQDKVSYPKTPPYLVFKRLFALKVFIENRWDR
ncbi:MAG: asparagine synthase-related protein [Bacteroidota bacterium]|nr:MAG: hypothetical protein DIU61_03200 [Bacteroidota bacterium]